MKTTTRIYKQTKTLALLASVFFIFSCKKIENASVTNYYARSDIAATEAAFSALNSSLMETEGSFLNATCDASPTYRVCSIYGGTDYKAIYNWNSCTFDNSKISVDGVWWSYFYDDATTTCPVPNAVSKEVKRITVGTDPVKYTMSNTNVIQMSTQQNMTFPGQALGSDGILTLQFDVNTRKLRVNTMEVKRVDSVGTTLYDVFLHSGSAGTQMTVTGKLSTSNRVLNGQTHVYFRESERALINFTGVTWSDSACCYPKSGSMALSFDNFDPSNPTAWPSSGKTATLNFTNTCGQATMVGTDGLTSNFTFSECF